MKRIFVLVSLVLITICTASAQKKDVLALTEELNTLKTQLAELTAVAESNKVLAEQLKTMVSAYQTLENAYKSNSEQVALLTAKIDELVAASATKDNAPAEAAKPEYEVIGDIHYGLAVIKQGVYYGFVNANGEVVIEPKYEEVTRFDRNIAQFRMNDKWGVIDTTGKVVIAAQYDEISDFDRRNIAEFFTNGKYGLINSSGKVIASAQFEQILSFDYECKAYEAKKDGIYYLVYLDGRVVRNNDY